MCLTRLAKQGPRKKAASFTDHSMSTSSTTFSGARGLDLGIKCPRNGANSRTRLHFQQIQFEHNIFS